MTLILSIIACPPKGFNPESSDGNQAIKRISEMMTERANESTPDLHLIVKRAAYVSDIAVALDELRDEGKIPSLIQIIGHGSRGRLQLGQYWTGKEVGEANRRAVLDSSPASYGVLMERISAPTKVLLLGCNVGGDAPSGFIASGRALLFDLEDLTGADVYAADDTVSPDDFDDRFFYKGSLVTSTGKAANPMVVVRAPASVNTSLSISTAPALLAPVSLKCAPALGIEGKGACGALTSEAKEFFAAYRRCDPQPVGLLAMTELELDLDGGGVAQIIVGFRYARVCVNGKTTYYECDNATLFGKGPAIISELRRDFASRSPQAASSL